MDYKLALMKSTGVIAIIRIGSSDRVLQIAQAITAGGIRCLEVTMNTPGALRAIEKTTGDLGEAIVGTGTVLDGTSARQAILAGAQFLVTPTVNEAVITMGRRYGVVVISGAMTPTEVLTAWEADADMVKLFPANALGSDYLKALRSPLPQIPIVPTGGITLENAGEFIRAGAAMVCAGGWLLDKKAVSEGRYEVLTERASQLVEAVRRAESRDVLMNYYPTLKLRIEGSHG